MYITNDKAKILGDLNGYLSAKTLGMFRYEGLPDTIPALELERLLQGVGFAFVSEVDGDLYALKGGLGGEPDAYGRPTTINVTNPALKLAKSLTLKDDGVLMVNDALALGLTPLFERYHTLMMENSINMEMMAFNSRAINTLSASDNKTLESAERYIKKLKDGEMSVIGDNAMFDGVKKQGGSASGRDTIKDLIEYNQFLKSSIYSEVGINTPFNMKRERVNADEVGQHEDGLFIFINEMKARRTEALEKINEKYGTNITVKFSRAWEKYNEPEPEEEPEPEAAPDAQPQAPQAPNEDDGDESQGNAPPPEDDAPDGHTEAQGEAQAEADAIADAEADDYQAMEPLDDGEAMPDADELEPRQLEREESRDEDTTD